jgi:hypothetical protein
MKAHGRKRLIIELKENKDIQPQQLAEHIV